MIYQEYRRAALDTAYLAACAVDGRTPDPDRIKKMDLAALYQAAEYHALTAAAAMALERAGVRDRTFTQALGKAIRKAALFDIEREAVLKALEEAGIWHMPLKGAVLKDLYPGLGMRQMADNDILCDPSRMEDVRTVMESLGFTGVSGSGLSVHEVYHKPPVLNFEMHRALFGQVHDRRIFLAFRDVHSRMLKDPGSRYGYHLGDEDFYLYMTAHAYKHYSGSGTGLRSLLDTYVYMKEKGETLDWSYINKELDSMGIRDFEEESRSLALHLFGGEDLTDREEEMLDYILSSGTYGTRGNMVRNRVSRLGGGLPGRLRYLRRRIFPPREQLAYNFPFFYRFPVFLPFLLPFRILRGLIFRRDRMLAELKALLGKTDGKKEQRD